MAIFTNKVKTEKIRNSIFLMLALTIFLFNFSFKIKNLIHPHFKPPLKIWLNRQKNLVPENPFQTAINLLITHYPDHPCDKPKHKPS